jgi:hypothetical protein
VIAQTLLQSPLEENLRGVLDRIERAARASGRAPDTIALLPVTKSVPADVAASLVALGRRELAENRADVLELKVHALAAEGLDMRWHFIGHLQRNKVRRVVRLADVLHSVDSIRLLEAIDRIAAEEGRHPDLFLQVELTGEAAKHGLARDEVEAAVQRAAELPHVRLLGLMAMGPLQGDSAPVFTELATLGHALAARHPESFADVRCLLSMGMSADLEQAVRAGSHLVRVGSALFEGVPQTGRSAAETGGTTDLGGRD